MPPDDDGDGLTAGAMGVAFALRSRRLALLDALLPRTGYVNSRRWGFMVNQLAASPLVDPDVRKAIYRRMGMDIALDSYRIGAHCYIHSHALSIGPNTFINDCCWFENVARVAIGSWVSIAPHVVIITSGHSYGPSYARSFGGWSYEPVTIEDGSWIGARATILPGVTVGRGGVIAAGAVVTTDTEPDCVYGGVPARKVKELDPDLPLDPKLRERAARYGLTVV